MMLALDHAGGAGKEAQHTDLHDRRWLHAIAFVPAGVVVSCGSVMHAAEQCVHVHLWSLTPAACPILAVLDGAAAVAGGTRHWMSAAGMHIGMLLHMCFGLRLKLHWFCKETSVLQYRQPGSSTSLQGSQQLVRVQIYTLITDNTQPTPQTSAAAQQNLKRHSHTCLITLTAYCTTNSSNPHLISHSLWMHLQASHEIEISLCGIGESLAALQLDTLHSQQPSSSVS